MPNWCSNNVVVIGPVEEIAHFRQTCIRQDEKGELYFDFNSLIPMPAILEDTVAGGRVDVALSLLGSDDLVWFPRSIEEQMKYWQVSDIDALKDKIGPEAFDQARHSIEAFEQTGAPNWYVWSNRNWSTKWNACDFAVIREEPGRYECRFETAWSPPEPVYIELAATFPRLSFEISGGDDQLNFDFEATARDGNFNIQYGDPNVEGFWLGLDSDNLLDHAKAYGNDPKRFLCVALCRAVTSNQRNSENEDPKSEKAVVAWARGDSKEESENSCRDVIARNHRGIKTLITDWQFTVYAPGEVQFQACSQLEARAATTDDDLPF
jgi:Ferredoxin-like domain in Api92-like protein